MAMAEEEKDNLVELEKDTTSSDISKVVDDLSKVELVEGDESWAGLEEMGISKRMVFNIVLFLIFLIGGAIYVIVNLDNWFSPDKEIKREEDKEIIEDVVDVDDVEVVREYEGEEAGLVSSLIVGIEFQLPEIRAISSFGNDSGAFSGLSFGFSELFSGEEMVIYLDLLKRLENAYATDVYNVVDQSVDRRAALDAHIALLAGLMAEGSNMLLGADQDLASLRLRFETLATARDLYEGQFFTALDLLEGRAAQENFEAFMTFGSEVQVIRARFNALGAIADRIESALSFLQPRYQDIVVNQEAILEGVRVFDVPGSEIDAIIPVEGI